jgi:O-antigen ligase
MQTSIFDNKKLGIISLVAVAFLAVAAAVAITLRIDMLVILIIGGVVGLVGFIAIYKRPALGAALILGLAPLEGVATYSGQSAVKLITVLCVGIFILKMIFSRKEVIFDRTSILIIILIVWALITVIWSPDQSSSLSEWISFALQAVLYIILINFIESREDLKIALWGHVIGGTILAIGVTNQMVRTEFLRSQDVLGLGINLASRLIGLNLLLTFLLYQFKHKSLAKLLLLVSFISSGIGVVATLSRGTWLGIAMALSILAVFFLFSRKLTIPFGQILIWAIVAVVIFMVLSNFILSEHALDKLVYRFRTGFSLSDSAGGRFEIWKVGWQIFSDAPIQGHGFNSFSQEFRPYYDDSGLTGSFHVAESKHAHNAYVQLATELGLIGLGVFIAMAMNLFYRAVQLLKYREIGTIAFFLAIFTFLFVATMVDSGITRKYLWYTFSILALMTQYGVRSNALNNETKQMDQQ